MGSLELERRLRNVSVETEVLTEVRENVRKSDGAEDGEETAAELLRRRSIDGKGISFCVGASDVGRTFCPSTVKNSS